jgi:hypothetical protein
MLFKKFRICKSHRIASERRFVAGKPNRCVPCVKEQAGQAKRIRQTMRKRSLFS